jgi:hypothetical protein
MSQTVSEQRPDDVTAAQPPSAPPPMSAPITAPRAGWPLWTLVAFALSGMAVAALVLALVALTR